jgi:hypothetical protein
MQFERIAVQATQRKCVECLKPATHWRYSPDKKGFRVDRSSRRPVCAVHAGK